MVDAKSKGGVMDAHFLPDGSRWPCAEYAAELEYDCRYGNPTREELLQIASILAAYWHLVAHPAGTEAAIKSLRMLRRAEMECAMLEEVSDD